MLHIAHCAMADVRAMKDVFTLSSLAPLLTLRNRSSRNVEQQEQRSYDSQQLIKRIAPRKRQFGFMKTESVMIIFARDSKTVLWSRSLTNG